MTIYLGLGANLGDRKANITLAIEKLQHAGFELHSVSPMVESPAMLPEKAEPDWAKPFLNLVICGEADWTPRQGLAIAKQVEAELGRTQGPRWAPRPMDIDLLIWHDVVQFDDALTLPHKGIADRDFVITPLMHMSPGLVVPGLDKTVFELSRGRRNIPLWMAIVNITPDSFSDGNSWFDREELGRHIDKLIDQNIQIIDVGAESTRPRAEQIDPDSEWQRLQPVLDLIDERLAGRTIRPLVSVDSRHPPTIARAIAAGVDIINDVSGLDDPEMMAIARDSDCQVVAMHAMTVPVDPAVLLPMDESAVTQMTRWIRDKTEAWVNNGIDLERMIIDPGIGFGKSPAQAYQLMSSVDELRAEGLRLLIGHSRKSFMAAFSDRSADQRDLETLGISLALCQQGVDIIRVHQPFIHQRAYRAWSHISPSVDG